MSATTHSDEVGSSAAIAVQLDAVGSVTMAKARLDVLGPSAAAVTQLGTTAHNNTSTAVETLGTEEVPEAAIDEEAPDEKSNPTAMVPPS